MKLAICDDDRDFGTQTANMLAEALDNRGLAAEVAVFSDAAALLKAREAGAEFEAYLLDILMPGTDGMTLARKIRASQPNAPIAFLTTSQDHALEACSLDASSYVLKPIGSERMNTVVDRLLALLPRPEEEKLIVRTSEGESRAVAVEKIALAESDGHYWRLHLSDGQQVRCRISAGELWERLSSVGRFVQVDRGVIVGVAAIRSLSAAGAVLLSGRKVAVSRRALPEVRRAFLRWNCR